MKIALIHNLKSPTKNADLPADYYSECDSPKTIEAIARALRSAGHVVLPVEADRRLPGWLLENPVDLAFNIAEGFEGQAREARVPALLELMEIPYTGSGVLTLILALDKARSKQLFRAAGIPTPNFQLIHHPEESLRQRLHFPLIVKPNREGSAKGIWATSVVHDEATLMSQVEKVFTLYAQEVLVEEFIEGTELTVGILGTEETLPVLEIDFSDCAPSGEFFYSWRMKEFQGNEGLHLNPRFWCPARLREEVTHAVQEVARKAARALDCRDLARVDIRLSSEGIPYVLEVNPLPGLDPEESNLPFMAQAAGISYRSLIRRIVNLAVERVRRVPKVSSFDTLSNMTGSKTNAPAYRALPDSVAKALGPPGNPVIVPPASGPKGPVAVRRANGRRSGTRQEDPKEGDLGR